MKTRSQTEATALDFHAEIIVSKGQLEKPESPSSPEQSFSSLGTKFSVKL